MLLYAQRNEILGFSLRDMFSVDFDFIKTYLKTSAPVIANEFIWALGMVMYSAAFARIGADAVAATQIMNSVQNFYSVLFIGIGNALASRCAITFRIGFYQLVRSPGDGVGFP